MNSENARARIEKGFPNLNKETWSIESEIDRDYNCMAWAIWDNTKWWQPPQERELADLRRIYWPPGAPNDNSVDGYVKACEMLGYEKCEGASLERGFEKVALFDAFHTLHTSDFTHAARQLPSGRWASKLGQFEDIEHDTVVEVEGDLYGNVAVFMKRPLTR